MLRLRKALRGRLRWVVHATLFAITWLCIDGQNYLYAYEQHRKQQAVYEKIAENMGVDVGLIADPDAYIAQLDRKRRREQKRRQEEQERAREEASQIDHWSDVPAHVRAKKSVADRYKAYLLGAAGQELEAIAAEESGEQSGRGKGKAKDRAKAKVRKTRADKARARAAKRAYELGIEGMEATLERLEEAGLPRKARERARRHLEKTRRKLGPAIEQVGRAVGKPDADAERVLGSARAELRRSLRDEKKIARKEAFRERRTRNPSMRAPKKKQIQTLDLGPRAEIGVDRKGPLTDPEAVVTEAEIPAHLELMARAPSERLRIAALGSFALDAVLKSALGADPERIPGSLSTAMDEVTCTAEIQALADELGNNPLRIYNHLRQNFRWEAYWGSLKGAQGALEERSGNDLDLASLLIALLRCSGINAEYVEGKVDLTEAQVQNLTGITDTKTAGDYLVTAGVPAVLLTSGGKIVGLRMSHVWVRAFLDYVPTRGAEHQAGDTWVPMDVAIRPILWQNGVDLRSEVTFEGKADYLEGGQSGHPHPLDVFREEMWTHIRENGIDCTTLHQVTRAGQVQETAFPYVPSSLAVKRVNEVRSWTDQVPDDLQHKLRITADGLDWTDKMAVVYGKTLAIQHPPATQEDQDTIDFYGGLFETPPYMIELKPSLRLNGTDVATATPQGGGEAQLWDVRFTVPGDEDDVLTYELKAGETSAFALDYGNGPAHEVQQATESWRQAKDQDPESDETIVKGLHAAGKTYFHDFGQDLWWAFGLKQVRHVRRSFAGLLTRKVKVTESGGSPQSWEPGERNIDIGRILVGSFAADGDETWNTEAMSLAGYSSSYREHDVWEAVELEEAISAVKALRLADQDGVNAILEIAANTDPEPTLANSSISEEDKDWIRDAVNGGRDVAFTQDEVALNAWSGAAWISEDPDTGAATYMLSGGLAGGDTTQQTIDAIKGLLGSEEWLGGGPLAQLLRELLAMLGGGGGPGANGPGGSSAPETIVSDPVNLSNGNLWKTETDFTLVAKGLPVTFTRTYNSLDDRDGPLGWYWTHTYNVTLEDDASGASPTWGQDVLLREADGTRHVFTWDGTSAYLSPDGKHMSLTQQGADWKLGEKDGSYQIFDDQGRLVEIGTDQWPDVEITVVYDATGRLDKVVDEGGRDALTFTYDANDRIETVTDHTGRAWTYGYDAAGNLVSALDPENATTVDQLAWTWSYDEAHRMLTASNPLGHTDEYAYDTEGRMYAHTDPLGHTEHFFYDQAGKQAVMVDARGHESLISYDDEGRATSAVDPLGNETTQAWDADNNRTALTNARGMETTWSYDAQGNPTAETFDNPHDADPAETNWTRTYESQYSRIETDTDAEGNQTSWDYTDPLKTVQTVTPDPVEYPDTQAETSEQHFSSMGEMVKTVEVIDGGAGDVVNEYAYDPNGALDSTTDPLGTVTDYVPDARGQIETVDGPSGTIDVAYDEQGRMESAVTDTGQSMAMVYDEAGRREEMISPRGTTSYTLDDAGRVVTTTQPDGGITENVYDPEGNVVARKDPRGHTTETTYDPLGRVTSRTGPDGKTWTTGFCGDLGGGGGVPGGSCGGGGCGTPGNGSICHLYGPDGTKLFENEIDDRGRVVKSIDALGHEVIYEYDEMGRKTAEQWQKTLWDSNGDTYEATIRKEYEYDHKGNLTAVVDAHEIAPNQDPAPPRTEYTYDRQGNLTEMLDAEGRTWKYGHDKLGRMTWEETPLITDINGTGVDEILRTQYAYDDGGNKIVTLHPDGSAIRNYYDLAPEATSRGTIGDDNPRTLDEVRIVVEGAIPDGADGHPDLQAALDKPRTEWTWDSELEYDDDARRKRMENADTKKTYHYTPEGRLEWVRDHTVDGDGDPTTYVEIRYTYDLNGNRATMIAPVGTTTYRYNAMNRLVEMTDPETGTFAFEYDDYGRRSALNYPNGVRTTYAYDLKGQVTSIIAKNDQGVIVDAWHYEYDAVGNRLTKTDKDGGVETYEYDALDRLTFADYPWGEQETFVYDDVGNRAELHDQDKDVTYSYDEANRIRQEIWTFLDGSPQETIDYTFDERGNRDSKVHHMATGDVTMTLDWDIHNRLTDLTDSTQGTFSYQYDPTGTRSRVVGPSTDERLLYAREDIVAEYDALGLLDRWYAHGPGVDEPLGTRDSDDLVSSLHADALGSIVAVTGTQGQVSGFATRRAYGEMLEGNGILGRHGFTARESDTSGVMYYRARYYDSDIGVFLSRDTFSGVMSVPASLNRFAYAHGNPITNVDPYGNFVVTLLLALALAWAIAAVGLLVVLGFVYFLGDEQDFDEVFTALKWVSLVAALLVVAAGLAWLAWRALLLLSYIRKNTYWVGPNPGGRIVGVVLRPVGSIQLHAPHPGGTGVHGEYHLQLSRKGSSVQRRISLEGVYEFLRRIGVFGSPRRVD